MPDWRVRDISGASFAGFYYVCAELGDMSEWTPGSVEPSQTRLGRPTRTVGLPTRISSSPLRSASLVRTPASHRRLGSQSTVTADRPTSTAEGEGGSGTRAGAGPRPLHAADDPDETATAAVTARTVASLRSVDALMEDAISQPLSEGSRSRARSPAAPAPASERERGRPERRESPSASAAAAAQPPASTGTGTGRTQGPGRITAFYFHENSEPYQQLDLRHEPPRGVGAFEMR